MTFAALPLLYVTWDESAVAFADFLRYQVYRRPSGETTWTKIARITDRGVTFYQDYNVASGIEYQYAVTQVKDVAGEEVESAFPTEVSTTVTLVSSFLHDVAAPANYAELDVVSQDVDIAQAIGFVQPWGRQAPTMHIGNVEQRSLRQAIPIHWLSEEDVWTSLVSLQSRQRTNGALLCYRDARGLRVFAQLAKLQKNDQDMVAGVRAELREVHYREEVD